jgi:DivIVA domain-containing protein
MRRKKGTEQDAPAVAGQRITPEEVQQVEFRLAFRGYNERDVDAFLDRITEDLSAYAAEGRAPGTPTEGGAAPSAEAEQIVARARAEADEILRRAREDAANIRTAATPVGSGDARAAVAPFLNNEREFLQSLGSLVQSHAEEIKQMVMALRARTDTAAGEPSTGQAVDPSTALAAAPPGDVGLHAIGEETGSSQTMSSSQIEAAPVSEIRARLEAAGPNPPVTLSEEEAADDPVDPPPLVVDSGTEPVFSTEGSPAGERRERSLRELFWGEE